MSARRAAAVVLALGLLGCGFDRFEIERVAGPVDESISIGPTELTLPLGVALTVRGVGYNKGGDEPFERPVDIASGDEELVAVYPTQEEGRFVVVALALGETCLELSTPAHDPECVTVTVVEP